MTTTKDHSPAPWGYEYSPYTVRTGTGPDRELPAFAVYDAEGTRVFDTNEDQPAAVQEANARLGAAGPEMLAALELAQRALNTAPRFRVGDTDSYRIAATVDRAVAQARGNPLAPPPRATGPGGDEGE